MNKIWKPTKQEIRRITAAASLESSPRLWAHQIELEPGKRHSTNLNNDTESINILLVSIHPNWDDTDLAEVMDFDEFKSGVELTSDGKAVVDLYIRCKDDELSEAHGTSLYGNIVVYYDTDRLIKILGCHNDGYDYLNPDK